MNRCIWNLFNDPCPNPGTVDLSEWRGSSGWFVCDDHCAIALKTLQEADAIADDLRDQFRRYLSSLAERMCECESCRKENPERFL